MKRKYFVSPSILSANFANLEKDIKLAEKGNAGSLHIDIMDGHFVPNLTIGPPVVKAISNTTGLPLDVHLMIENPDKYIDEFAEAGAYYIAVHFESCTHINRTLDYIKSFDCKAGVALNPGTPVDFLKEIVKFLDFVIIMTVNPGFGGQKFIEGSFDKISRARKLLDRYNPEAIIQVDGGVSLNNISDLANAGACMFVSGSSVYKSDNPVETLNKMNDILDSFQEG